MSLITIASGSEVKSAPLNSNFTYLDGRITTTNTTLSSAVSTLQASISTTTSNSTNKDLSNLSDTGKASIFRAGMIVYYGKSTAPTGWLICDGSAISRTTYADLFTIIGTTFGSGDESTTFNLPDLIDKFPQGNTTVGTVKTAGLPDHSHTVSASVTAGYGNIASGLTPFAGATTSNTSSLASASSSIYGNSTTVQPPALTLLPIIKY